MTTAITEVRLFDGESVHESMTVLFRDDRIIAVGREVDIPADAEIVDGRGRTLLPGLIDAHAHSKPGALRAALAFGVTTEMDLGSSPEWMDEQRRLAASRNDLADVRSSSFGMTVRGSHPSRLIGGFFPNGFPVVDTVDDVAPFVRDRLAEGADIIKVLFEDNRSLNRELVPELPVEFGRAAVEEAHRHGKLAVAHVTNLACAMHAVEAGVDGIVHMFIDELPTPEFIEAMRERNGFVIPTLVTVGPLAGDRSAEWVVEDGRIDGLVTEEWRDNLCSHWGPHDHGHFEIGAEGTRMLWEAGVTVLIGTDAASPAAKGTAHGVSVHDEMAIHVDAGIPVLEVLRAVTSRPADVYGLSDRGRIQPGKQADLLLVEGDPTSVITDSLSIEGIWRRGERFDRDAYRDEIRGA